MVFVDLFFDVLEVVNVNIECYDFGEWVYIV